MSGGSVEDSATTLPWLKMFTRHPLMHKLPFDHPHGV
jgi:hypothetical protein